MQIPSLHNRKQTVINLIQKGQKFVLVSAPDGPVMQCYSRGRLFLRYANLTTGDCYKHYYTAPKFFVIIIQ